MDFIEQYNQVFTETPVPNILGTSIEYSNPPVHQSPSFPSEEILDYGFL